MTRHTAYDINNVLYIPTARRGPLLAPRYAFVRNAQMELADRDSLLTPDARYDIVDNGEGSEQVLAYGVKYRPAMLIVSALNMLAEAERIEQLREDQEIIEEVPAPAPAA